MRPHLLGFTALVLACAHPPEDSQSPSSPATPTPTPMPMPAPAPVPEPTPDGMFDVYVVDWSAADRSELERRIAGGRAILVHVEGRRATLEPDCRGETSAHGTSWNYLRRGWRDEHVVVGGAAIDVTVAGQWFATFFARRASELSGTCDRVTHVVASLEVGAFTRTAGEAPAAGGGGSQTANVTTATNGGDRAACATAELNDRIPPVGCSAVVRLSLTKVVR